MKIKDYIDYLKTLDQDRAIFVQYDSFLYLEPIPDRGATRDEEKFHIDEGVHEGDYLICVG